MWHSVRRIDACDSPAARMTTGSSRDGLTIPRTKWEGTVRMAVALPDHPRLANDSERRVWEALSDQLGEGDLVITGQRVTDHLKDHEIDFVVAIEGAGIPTRCSTGMSWASRAWNAVRSCWSSTTGTRSSGPENGCTSGYLARATNWWCAQTPRSSPRWAAPIWRGDSAWAVRPVITCADGRHEAAPRMAAGNCVVLPRV